MSLGSYEVRQAFYRHNRAFKSLLLRGVVVVVGEEQISETRIKGEYSTVT